MHYENVFKGDRCCSCYTCLPQTASAAQSVPRKMAPGTPPTDLIGGPASAAAEVGTRGLGRW